MAPDPQLSDEALRRLLEELRRPYTWRDEVRYWLTWRPRWAVREWRHFTAKGRRP